MNHLLQDATNRAIRYIENRNDRFVGPLPESIDALAKLRHSLPDQGLAPEAVLAQLDEFGSPATVCMTGPRYFGFVNGGTLPAALAANWLATAWDQNAALYAMSPVASVLEQIAIEWLLSVLNLPSQSNGALTTGATMASFTCLAAARHSVLAKAGWDVEAQGLFSAPPITVIAGEEVHVTILKALSLLGLGRDRVFRIPTDEQGRIRPGKLPPFDGPTIVCLQAGNVNSGAFDPAAEIIERINGRAWVHVDGAFGLWALAAPALRHLANGYERADSWATDGHKYLNVAYDCGIALVRDPSALKAAMSITAPYLTASPHREPMDWGPESSRRARGIDVWAALLSLGRQGLAEMIERCATNAQRFATKLKQAGCEILNDVVINQVLVSFGDDEKTRAVIQRVQQDGTCWCGGTVWHGKAAMRISISSWATTGQDVDRSVKAILSCVP